MNVAAYVAEVTKGTAIVYNNGCSATSTCVLKHNKMNVFNTLHMSIVLSIVRMHRVDKVEVHTFSVLLYLRYYQCVFACVCVCM